MTDSPVTFGWEDPRGKVGRPATMLEEVAFAICSCKPCICRNKAGFIGMPCLDHARKGIEAMRRPTKAMEDAALDAMEKDYLGGGRYAHNPSGPYRAMIDAALK